MCGRERPLYVFLRTGVRDSKECVKAGRNRSTDTSSMNIVGAYPRHEATASTIGQGAFAVLYALHVSDTGWMLRLQ
jgi:hypothetical protein